MGVQLLVVCRAVLRVTGSLGKQNMVIQRLPYLVPTVAWRMSLWIDSGDGSHRFLRLHANAGDFDGAVARASEEITGCGFWVYS